MLFVEMSACLSSVQGSEEQRSSARCGQVSKGSSTPEGQEAGAAGQAQGCAGSTLPVAFVEVESQARQIMKDVELSGLNGWVCPPYLPSHFLLSHQHEELSKSKHTSGSRRTILNILFSNRETP